MRLLQNRVEYRREVAGRGIDDPQYFSGRGLLFQCFTRLGQQPRVLHRDHRLRREVLEERNLLVGEWADLLSKRSDDAEQGFVFPKRYDQEGTDPAQVDQAGIRRGAPNAILRYGVVYMSELLPKHHAR